MSEEVQAGPKQPGQPPTTMLENEYKGYRIAYFDTKYFAVPASDGDFDIGRFHANQYSKVIIGHTLDEVKRELDLVSSIAHAEKAEKDQSKKPAGSQVETGLVEKNEELRRTREKGLFLCTIPQEESGPFLDMLCDRYQVEVLAAGGNYKFRNEPRTIRLRTGKDSPGRLDLNAISHVLLDELRSKNFDTVIVPFDHISFWENVELEKFAADLTNRLMIVHRNGSSRLYKGEEIHRLIYNKSYLCSMFRFVPKLSGKKLLEVGCSDGLLCDILLNEDPASVVGVDMLETTGCVYKDPKIAYYKMDGADLRFEDGTFDVSLSIAVLEHCADPLKVINEMKRVTAKGGYCYLQAGPLYHSPFGHHMFGYFDDYPWIHLRMSKDEIIDYSIKNGIDKMVQEHRQMEIKDYIYGMLNDMHINGKKLDEYGLSDLMKIPDTAILHFSKSYEGEDLLSKDIMRELKDFRREDLVGHGFELLFKVM